MNDVTKLVDVDFDAVYRTRTGRLVKFVKGESPSKDAGWCEIDKIVKLNNQELSIVYVIDIVTNEKQRAAIIRSSDPLSPWTGRFVIMDKKDLAAELAVINRGIRIFKEKIDHLEKVSKIISEYLNPKVG